MTIPYSSPVRLICFVAAIFLPVVLFAQMSSQRTIPGVRVPFVGCASDGQVGPLDAPQGSNKIVRIDPRAAGQLAYYQAEHSPGVLAPRGWQCFGTYGSAGATLYVSPEPYTSADVFSDKWKGFSGPAIEVSVMSGGTSGRFGVAKVAARVFPMHKAFVKGVIAEGLEPASDFPFGPYPKDKLTYHGDSIVEYQTPPHAEGLGTTGSLRANDFSISGVEMLQGVDTDLTGLAVRLPPALDGLAPLIIQQFERDNPAGVSSR